MEKFLKSIINLSLKISKPSKWKDSSEIIYMVLIVGKWTTIHGVFSCDENAKTISNKFNSGWARPILSNLIYGLPIYSKLGDFI